ncbi:hypothetical protein AB0E81_16285 [Streptomyces sp. NPDC033538]
MWAFHSSSTQVAAAVLVWPEGVASRADHADDYKPYLDERWYEGCTNA